MSTDFDPLYQWLGIPPSEQPPHCYRLLGLRAFEDNIQTIQDAADRQTAYLQTLTAGPRAQIAQELISQIDTARAWLLNPENKAQYDAWLRPQLGTDAAAAVSVPPVVQMPMESQTQETGPDLSDVLGGSEFYVESQRSGPKVHKRQSVGTFVAVAGGILALIAVALGIYLLQDLFSETGTLVVEWPEEERSNGILEIDGKRVEMTAGPEITCRVSMGAHAVKCTRPGFEPFEVTMPVTSGKTTTLRPEWRKTGSAAEASTADSF